MDKNKTDANKQKSSQQLTSGEVKIVNIVRIISSVIKHIYKSLIVRRFLIATLLLTLLGVVIPTGKSINLKKQGEELYKNAKYDESLVEFTNAKDWWVLEKISSRLYDRDLYYKIQKAEVMIESEEYYQKGLRSFSEEKYQDAINYFSSMAEKDPNIDDAYSKIEECKQKIGMRINASEDVPEKEQTQMYSNVATSPKTYPIISLGDISNLPEKDRKLLTNAYNEFLQTPNLIYLDTGQQNSYLQKVIEKYIIEYKEELKSEIEKTQDEIDKLREDDSTRYPPAPIQNQVDPEIEAKLNELRDTLGNIQNQPVAMEIIEGRLSRAYQNWISGNSEIYNKIVSSWYSTKLNTILRSYGL